MKKLFYPKAHFKSIYEVDIAALKERGIEGIILDLDDTLLKKSENHTTPKLIDWVNSLKEEGFRLCISSNGVRPLRVETIGEELGIPVITLAFKPFPFAFFKAFRLLDAPPHRIAIIGDFIFTDILGGNLYGMYPVLVDPIENKETFFLRQLMRYCENLIYPKKRGG